MKKYEDNVEREDKECKGHLQPNKVSYDLEHDEEIKFFGYIIFNVGLDNFNITNEIKYFKNAAK